MDGLPDEEAFDPGSGQRRRGPLPHQSHFPQQNLRSFPHPGHFHRSDQLRFHPGHPAMANMYRGPHGDRVRPPNFFPYSSGWSFDVPGSQSAATPERQHHPSPQPPFGVMSAGGAAAQGEDSNRAMSVGSDPGLIPPPAGTPSRKRPPPTILEASATPKIFRGSSEKDKSSAQRWAKRFFWPDDLHRDFVSAIFDIGLKHATAPNLMEKMGPEDEEINVDRVKGQLECYRSHRMPSREADGTPSPTFDEGAEDAKLPPVSNFPRVAVPPSVAAAAATTPHGSTPTSPGAAAAAAAENSSDKDESEDKKKPARPLMDSIEFPRFTEEEKRSPVVASLGYLVGILNTLTNQLEEQRAEKAAANATGAAAAPSGSGLDERPNGSPQHRRFLVPGPKKGATRTVITIGDRPPKAAPAPVKKASEEEKPFDVFEANNDYPLPDSSTPSASRQGLASRQKFFPDEEDAASLNSLPPVDMSDLYSQEVPPSPHTHSGHAHAPPTPSHHYRHHSPHPTTTTSSSSSSHHHHGHHHHHGGPEQQQHPQPQHEEDVVDEHLFESLKAYCADAFEGPTSPRQDRSD